MRQRIPGRRIASDHQAVQHGEQGDSSDSRRAVEIHGAAALSRDLGEAQIERGSGGGGSAAGTGAADSSVSGLCVMR